jgi:DNA-binding HxlR family transcriptional regulator
MSNTNQIDNAIAMISDAHMLCIIHHLSSRAMRFNELQRAINGLNPTTLTDRLKRLEKEKILIRKEETVDKVSVVYELTVKGRAVLPIINEIGKFADTYL